MPALHEMTYLLQIDPIALAVGPLKIHWYGLMYLLGFAVAWWLGHRRIRQGRLPGVDQHGFGDLFVQGYYIPTHKGAENATELGFGAATMLDTASHDSLGTGKYSVGPALILVHKTGKWTLGALGNHLWSVGGDSDRDDVVLTNLQPFVAYSLGKGWAINSTSEMSYNWEARSSDRWTIPLGGTVSRVVPIGHIPVSFAVGAFYNVERPEYANRWTARLIVTLAFPE